MNVMNEAKLVYLLEIDIEDNATYIFINSLSVGMSEVQALLEFGLLIEVLRCY